RLGLAQRLAIEHRVVEPELALPARRLGEARVALALRAEDLDPARGAEERLGVRLARELAMVGEASLDELRVDPRDPGVAPRARVMPIRPQERCQPRPRRGGRR